MNEGERKKGKDFKSRKRQEVNNNNGKGDKGEESQSWIK